MYRMSLNGFVDFALDSTAYGSGTVRPIGPGMVQKEPSDLLIATSSQQVQKICLMQFMGKVGLLSLKNIGILILKDIVVIYD